MQSDSTPRPMNPYLEETITQPIARLAGRIAELEAEVARLRQALIDAGVNENGLAGEWVAWQFDASHHGIVLEHDHTRNAVKIAHNGDSTATYWLDADQVYVVEEARDGR